MSPEVADDGGDSSVAPSESDEARPGEDGATPLLATVNAAKRSGQQQEQQQQPVGLHMNTTPILTDDHQELVSDILDIVGNSMAVVPMELPAHQLHDRQAELAANESKASLGMLKELVAFTLPLLVVWLSNPVMSLVDTAVVGAHSSVELAALGPGTSLCDNLAYMCGFLAQVTTNLAASALARGDGLKADRATRTGMFVGAGTGLAASFALLKHGRSLLQFWVGDNTAVASVLPHACSYVYIRALGFVAVTLSMVLQSTYLARKDIATPIKSVAGASIVNLVLDCVAVFVFGMGIKGAALSTTAAQWAGLLYLVKKFWPDLKRSGKVSFLPYRQELMNFLQLGVPMCLALSGQVATCIAVTVAASGCDTVALAAHQILYGVFLLFCPVGEAVSQTVQTYLPGFTVKRPPAAGGKPRKTLTFGKSAVRMIKEIGAVSLGLGAVNAVLSWVLTAALPCLFTPDRAVRAAVRSGSYFCGLSMGLHGITMAFQGAMMATREVYPTAAIYTVCSVFFSGKFLMMRRSPSLRLTSVWAAFVVYQVTRCFLFAATLGWSHRASFRANFFSPAEVEARGEKGNKKHALDADKAGSGLFDGATTMAPTTAADALEFARN